MTSKSNNPQRRTSDLFSADSKSQKIIDIKIAYNEFKRRMTEIGNQYTGEKQNYFFKQLNHCELDRFKALSTENNQITLTNVREAEAMLQSEFEGPHEPNSITRPTEAEVKSKNFLDARFRKGVLSGEYDSLNEHYTDLDVKTPVSAETLEYQVNQRKILGNKNATQPS